MSKKQDCMSISVGEAMSALELHIQQEMMWRMKAITLLQMVGESGVDSSKLKQQCKDLAERGLSL